MFQRQRTPGQPGARTACNHRYLSLVTQLEQHLHLFEPLGQYHQQRYAAIGAEAVALVGAQVFGTVQHGQVGELCVQCLHQSGFVHLGQDAVDAFVVEDVHGRRSPACRSYALNSGRKPHACLRPEPLVGPVLFAVGLLSVPLLAYFRVLADGSGGILGNGPTSRHDMHNKPQIADVVCERIERLIVDGVLKTGQPLPSERRLVEKLGVSRNALREGLKLLRARGIIATEQGRGSFVASLSPANDATPLMHLFSSQPRTLYDLFEVRSLLEGESARLAALRGTQADFVLIERSYQALLAAHDQPLDATRHAHLDHAFHLAICDASHNPVLVQTLRSLTDLLLNSVFACVNNLYHRQPQKQQIDKQHAKLYTAVINRQPEQARKAAVAHIESICANLREIEGEEQRLVRATMRLEGWT